MKPLDSDPHAAQTSSSDPEGTDTSRVARPRRACPADAVRPTRAEINLAALRHNLRALERYLGPSRPRIWGVLKADAYGHGAPAVARTLERAGIDGLCVALLEEGIELREAGVKVPILVMGGYYGRGHRGLEDALAHDLVPVIYDLGQLEHLARWIRSTRRTPARVHVKVDTGMGRLGLRVPALAGMVEAISMTPEVELVGVMSHLACADAVDPTATLAQLRLFDKALEICRRASSAPVSHIANSAGSIRFERARLHAIRPGLALFGISPIPDSELSPQLAPVMRVRTEIVALREIKPGDAVGYNHTYRATEKRRIATIPIGYADGFDRALSGKGHVLVRGRRAPLAGTVSMDLAGVDVSDIPGVSLGDEVVVLGAQDGPLGSDNISAREIAETLGGIPWETVTHISRRVPRFYREP